jgi:hypothetical protein
VPGGDFDMWLWITRIQRTLSLTVSPFQIIGGDTARVGAEVSAQLSQDTPLAFTSTSPNFLFTSVPVALPAGSRVVEAAAVTLPVLEAKELDVGAQLGPPANITSNRVRVRVLPRFLKVVSVSFLAGARSDNPDVVRRLTTNPQSIANFNELIDGVELVFNVPLADSLLDDDVSLTLFPERNPARVPVNSRLTSAEQLVVSWEHAAGSFEFRLSGSADSRLRGQANQPFDGEARQLPSGDDAAGGDFVIKFSVGPG